MNESIKPDRIRSANQKRFVQLADEIILRVEEADDRNWWDDVFTLSYDLEVIRRCIGFPKWKFHEPEWPAFFIGKVHRDDELHGINAEFLTLHQKSLRERDWIATGVMLTRDPLVESFRTSSLWTLKVNGGSLIYANADKSSATKVLHRWIRFYQQDITDLQSRDIDAIGKNLKNRGRPKPTQQQIETEDQLVYAWQNARENGVYKADFAKDNGFSSKEFEAILNRVSKRNSRSDK